MRRRSSDVLGGAASQSGCGGSSGRGCNASGTGSSDRGGPSGRRSSGSSSGGGWCCLGSACVRRGTCCPIEAGRPPSHGCTKAAGPLGGSGLTPLGRFGWTAHPAGQQRVFHGQPRGGVWVQQGRDDPPRAERHPAWEEPLGHREHGRKRIFPLGGARPSCLLALGQAGPSPLDRRLAIARPRAKASEPWTLPQVVGKRHAACEQGEQDHAAGPGVGLSPVIARPAVGRDLRGSVVWRSHDGRQAGKRGERGIQGGRVGRQRPTSALGGGVLGERLEGPGGGRVKGQEGVAGAIARAVGRSGRRLGVPGARGQRRVPATGAADGSADTRGRCCNGRCHAARSGLGCHGVQRRKPEVRDLQAACLLPPRAFLCVREAKVEVTDRVVAGARPGIGSGGTGLAPGRAVKRPVVQPWRRRVCRGNMRGEQGSRTVSVVVLATVVAVIHLDRGCSRGGGCALLSRLRRGARTSRVAERSQCPCVLLRLGGLLLRVVLVPDPVRQALSGAG
mmetsp:Transcript_14371/g.54385  ORF Transcript_14371/g.54385 Transcript_14371/m.54385 type:complete len:505 (-) Transcript_14371:1115-2629(-)